MPKGSSQSDDGLSVEFFSQDDIFGLEALKSFKPSAWLTHMQVTDDHIFVTTLKNTLIRFCPTPPMKVSEVEITRLSDDRVNSLFVDPTGWHVIISMQSGTNFYTNRNMKKVRILSKAKDLLIDSVAWSPHNNSEVSTQEILIGTNDGFIFETVLVSDEGRLISGTPEQYWKQVTNLGHSVTGLAIIRHPPGSIAAVVGEAQRCVILATTPSRMYQFAGWINPSGTNTILSHLTSGSPPKTRSASVASNLGVLPSDASSQVGSTPIGGLFPTHSPCLYQNVFTPEDKLPAGSKVTEFPKSFGYSDLKLYQVQGDELPYSFAWMTGSGVFFGYFNAPMLSLPPFSLLPTKNTVTAGSFLQEDTDHSLETFNKSSSETVKHTEDVFSGRVMNFTQKTKLISYPVIRRLEHTSSPLGICLTAFHIIIAYTDRIKVVNVLDDQTVYSMPVDLGVGHVLGVCRDPHNGHVWVAASQGIVRLTINNEAVRIWKIHLDRADFTEARKYCQNASQLDTVNIREAESCFAQGDFMKSANLFAQTSVPFEEAALKFSQLSLMHQKLPPGSPLVSQGFAVTSDHDIMDSILRSTEPEVPKENSSDHVKKTSKPDSISTSAPLKELISSKLEQLLAHTNESERKLKSTPFGPVSDSPTQGKLALLVLWLAELQLTEIGILRDRPSADRCSDSLDRVRREFQQLFTQPEVRALLPEAKDLLYEICESQGNNEELVFIAEITGDFDRLIDHYIRLGQYESALRILGSHPSCLSRVYDNASVLVLHCPEQTVNTWLRLSNWLDPVKLLPAIMLLPHAEAMRYLHHVVQRCPTIDQAVHHLLVSLCAEAFVKISESSNNDSTSTDPLMEYLEFTSSHLLNIANLESHPMTMVDNDSGVPVAGQASAELSITTPFSDPCSQLNIFSFPDHENQLVYSALPYDPGFVLRTCREVGHLRGTVFVLKLLGLHKQALETAIDHNDVALAKEIAQNDMLSQDIRRQLWITLARHLISKQGSIEEATNLLRECPLLNLEDILPYFPDFATVDQFKEAICASLDSYHRRIEEVKHEMHLTVRSTDALRKQLDGLRSRHTQLRTDAVCTRCNYLLLSRAFYLFPCGHKFHTDCLIEQSWPYLNEDQRANIIELLRKPQRRGSASATDIQEKLDQLIASDCAICGRLAISAVSDLFFPDQSSYDSQLAVWQ